jgi:D-alanyl-D-alanine carboxypeptidase
MYNETMKRRYFVLFIVIALILFGAYELTQKKQHHVMPTGKNTENFDNSRYSLSDLTSPWVVVNKKRPLQPATYRPSSLVVPDMVLRSNITEDERQIQNVTADALRAMAIDAKKEGITLTLESGFRSYNFQVNLYARYVREQGQAVADTQSARAGYSEHQTGLAADIGGTTEPNCNVAQCYSDTVEGKWVAAHAYMYGFIIRYPNGKAPITGYEYEPWHVRYVGSELSAEMRTRGVETMEEFFHLPAAPDYN